MLGWEFPPHISGGLGTACAGLVQGLSKADVDVTFVVPRAHGDEDQRFAHVLGCNDVEVSLGPPPPQAAADSKSAVGTSKEDPPSAV